jgi:hypothetical protein
MIKEAQMPTTTIFIPKGTIVYELSNSDTVVKASHVTLNGDVYVDAIRHEDGGWGYSVGGRTYYSCAIATAV